MGINANTDILNRTIYPSPTFCATTVLIIDKAVEIEASDDENRTQINGVTRNVHTDISGLDIPLDRRSELGHLQSYTPVIAYHLIHTILNVNEGEVAFGIHLHNTLLSILVVAIESIS